MSSEESHDTAAAAELIPSSSTNSTSSGGLFTPSGLFIVLNLMIFTIALSSKLSNRKTAPKNHHQDEDDEFDDDAAAAGNFQQFRYQQQHVSIPENIMSPPNSSNSDPIKSFHSYGTEEEDDNEQPPRQTTTHQIPKQFPRVKSDTVRPKLRKSWSSVSRSTSSDYNKNNKEEEEDAASVEKRRVSDEQGKHVADNKEVDAMADDFINRFKHQLKLQRMDSFSRYR